MIFRQAQFRKSTPADIQPIATWCAHTGHEVARPVVADLASDLDHPSHAFMSQNEGWLYPVAKRGMSLNQMRIRSRTGGAEKQFA